MLLRLHQKIAPEWASNLVGLFETLSFARGSFDMGIRYFRTSFWGAYICKHRQGFSRGYI
jgi:hypothetical protein